MLVAEHQLDDADVDAVGKQPTGTFVPQVVPAQIDALQMFAVPFGSLLPCFARERRRSRVVSAFLFKRTPKRWNGDLATSGGVCAMPQLMTARSRSRTRPWITTGLHLADEQPLLVPRFFHRLDRPLLAGLHSRTRELVCRHAAPFAAPHRVESQVLQAPSAAAASPAGR
jgi:hypothetical protein